VDGVGGGRGNAVQDAALPAVRAQRAESQSRDDDERLCIWRFARRVQRGRTALDGDRSVRGWGLRQRSAVEHRPGYLACGGFSGWGQGFLTSDYYEVQAPQRRRVARPVLE